MRDRVLFIDDEPNIRKTMEAIFHRAGYDIACFSGFSAAIDVLNTEPVDVLITDLSMPEHDGMHILDHVIRFHMGIPVIVMTAYGSVESATSAMKQGAYDFLMKPVNTEELLRIVRSAIETKRRRGRAALEGYVSSPISILPSRSECLPLVGASAAAKRLNIEIVRATQSDLPVVLTGPPGALLRDIAQEIHARSDRSTETFLELGFSVLEPEFHAIEIFGTERGATPSTFFSRPGRLELAAGGVLFLEDVEALESGARALLNRAIRDSQFTRVGGFFPQALSAHLILAVTREESWVPNQELLALLRTIGGVDIRVPPIEERSEDFALWIPRMVDLACARFALPKKQVDPSWIADLSKRTWPFQWESLREVILQTVKGTEGPVVGG
jgi:DNA-binding NtrC family response regulator